ncbi:hypothetical protein [Cesiribacter sp. SM1]|uniref:hypothetical protein n=1 Tax=Cesiribacter sp. SM1 TaxID=2861196 RepID=UPI001CD5272E|nr:hypothetical protein [Cesiribacter sp. SM1]
MKAAKNIFSFILLLLPFVVLMACSDDDDVPALENEEEVISQVTLTFTPADGADALTFDWTDPEGPTLPVVDPVVLQANTEYDLTIELYGPNGENITEEVQEEAAEHLFFFGWSDQLFDSPTGTGNISNRSNTVDYGDTDSNNQPVGLATTWTTGEPASGTFRMVLKHQPNIKSATSTVNDGETDVDITWAVTVE